MSAATLTKRIEAEQFELFQDPPPRRYDAQVVTGDDEDTTTTLVVDGTREASQP